MHIMGDFRAINAENDDHKNIITQKNPGFLRGKTKR